MPADMRPFAERLAKAMPERFRFTKYVDEWFLDAIGAGGYISFRALGSGWSTSNQWGFWGPIADELDIAAVWRNTGHATTLEAIAEAVCQEAERRAKE